MNKTMIKTLLLSSCLFLAAESKASADKAGNGGDAACAEFAANVKRIAVALVNLGQSKVNKINSVIDVDQAFKFSSVSCVPVETLDREARSTSDATGKITTSLKWSSWV